MNPQISSFYPQKVLSFFILLFCLTHLHAKDVIVDGFYINLKGDTIRSKFILPLFSVKHVDESKSDDLYLKFRQDWLPNFKKIQWEIVITNCGEEKKLSPSDCSSFQFTYGEDTFRYISCPNKFFSRKNNYLYASYPDSIFLRVVISGQISLYQYFKYKNFDSYKHSGFGIIHYNKLKYLLKNPETPSYLHYNKRFFKKYLKKYIAESPSVLTKI